ncbi:efflux pump antibiotic resistance protein [Aspergillus eucalypticola CBS 122712]|uniref:Efflux pump antibiotic resistance protein n=1 Tax=Aspergillus eucalypticola (strain CBS 122712 / IBT 29274) TaxID=1448314 RepID=A0A317W7D7_ASPEC|nr:efflux pump antibiotic resistance protein [Aspergillus eucalypticola CBS 122712]PWY80060.1 efflux pump antibiotic resistance protein [Aspergillus eucalypticola CBS 122712]
MSETRASTTVEGHETAKNVPGHHDSKPLTWFLVVFSLLAALFLFALDNTIVANVQPAIIGTLGEIEKLPWISVAFALGAIATDLPWGQIYGHFNNKFLFLASVVIFEVGSAVCGAAPTMNALIVGRAICGIGGMGIYLGTVNMVSALTTEAQRPLYLGFVGLTWGIGTILGPIIGGAFADNTSATWRWSFYINLCIGGLAAPVYFWLLPQTASPRPGQSLLTRLWALDVVGMVLSAGAITSLIMAISFGGSMYAWGSGRIIGLFVCSGVLWLLFIGQQAWSLGLRPEAQGQRLFPTTLVRSWEMDVLFAQMASAQVLVMVPIYFLPILFQFAHNDSALASGVHLLPFVLVLVVAVMLNGALMAQLGYYMPWYLVGACLALAGSALFYTVGPDTSSARLYGYSVLTAFGVGCYSQAGFPVAQVKVSPAKLTQAVAFIGVGQVGGIALALTISNTIFLNKATSRISTILPQQSRSTIQQAISGVRAELFSSLSVAQRQRVVAAIVSSVDDVFVLMIAAAALSVVLALVMKRERLFVIPSQGDGEEVEEEVMGTKEQGLQ